jgi:hypothetical protein
MPGSSPEDQAEPKTVDETVEASSPDVKEVSAESSPAEKPGQKGDMLTAVKAALEPKEDSPDLANPDPKSEAKTADSAKEGEEADDDADDLTEEEESQLHRKTKKRILKLKETVSTLESRLGEYEPEVQQFRQVMGFVRDAGLSVAEVNDGFDVMRSLKQDPRKAYDRLKPVFAQLQQMFGDVLPEDLQQEVNLGRITEDRARELAVHRTTSTLSTQRADNLERQRQTERQQREFDDRRSAAASAVTAWENSKSKADPDWKLKQTRVTELIELDLYKRQKADPNYFPSTEDAVAMANAALEKVNGELKRFAPRRKAVDPAHDVASSRSTAAPTNMLEAAKQGLARARTG